MNDRAWCAPGKNFAVRLEREQHGQGNAELLGQRGARHGVSFGNR
jgi:hypothetical protein